MSISISSTKRFERDCVLTVFGHSNYYPAQLPKPTSAPFKPENVAHCDTEIGIIDVGFIQFGVDSRRNNAGNNEMDLPIDYLLPPNPLTEDVGHGESVAWITLRHVPQASITGLSVQPIWSGDMRHHGQTTAALLTMAIDEMIDRQVKIISLTAGGPVGGGAGGPMNRVHAAIIRATQAGILVVSAVGNDAEAHAVYPAAWDQVLAVGATIQDVNGNWVKAGFNNNWGGTDLWAPGRHVVPFVQNAPFGGTAEVLGTSFAVPVVVGEVAASCATTRADWNANPKAAALAALDDNQNELIGRGFLFPEAVA